MSIYVVGIDPGSTGDRTGISIVRRDRKATQLQTTTAMRGIKMGEIVQAALAIVRRLDQSLPPTDRIAVVIDRGGIGLGPAEDIERALKVAKKDGTLSRRIGFRAVHVVGGDSVTPDPKDPSRVSVGRDLLYERGMQALREQTLVVANADGDAVPILREELDGLVVTYSGARRTARTDHGKGKNDDVVFSLLLAFWLASTVGFGQYTNAIGAAKAMATALVGRRSDIGREKPGERASQPRPNRQAKPKPGPTATTVWTQRALLAVVERESLPIRAPHNLSAPALLAEVNAALVADGRTPLPGTAWDGTRPTTPPDGTWSQRLA